jgi:hypothetical protein
MAQYTVRTIMFVVIALSLQGCTETLGRIKDNTVLSSTSNATYDQAAKLVGWGIKSEAEISAAQQEMASAGYSSSKNINDLLYYLQDKRNANGDITIAIGFRDTRLVKRAREQARYGRNYPYKVVLTCEMQGQHNSIYPCMVGKYTKTYIEVGTSRSSKQIYQPHELQRLGNEYRDGFMFDAKAPLYVTAQNISEYFQLRLSVYDRRSESWVYRNGAGKYGTVGFKSSF